MNFIETFGENLSSEPAEFYLIGIQKLMNGKYTFD